MPRYRAATSRPLSRWTLDARRVVGALATPLAVLVAGGLVWQASYAAFTGHMRNSGNAWSTGSVAISDDDTGAARFQVRNIVPGDTGAKCIAVTASTSAPAEIRAYAVNPVHTSQPLAEHLLVSVERGTGGGFGSCDGFSADPRAGTPAEASLEDISTRAAWENSLDGWRAEVGNTTQTYRITWRFDTSGMAQHAVDALQGSTAGLDLQWESRTL